MPAPKGSRFDAATGKFIRPDGTSSSRSKKYSTPTGPPQIRGSMPVAAADIAPDVEPEPAPTPVPTFAPPSDEFVKPEDLKAPTFGRDMKTPGKGGWVADMIAAVGQKIHETEYIVTGDPKLQHGTADERIWMGVGRYVEEMVDIQKYGVMILLIALVSAEMTRAGILVMDLQRSGRLGPRRRPPPPREEREEDADTSPPPPQVRGGTQG